MYRRFLTIVLFAIALTSTGCGTLCNLAKSGKDDKIYGGVRLDLEKLDKIADSAPLQSSREGGPVALAFTAVDTALSAIGDTLTFPLAWWIEHRNTSSR